MLGCENTVIEGVDWREEDAGDGAGPQLRVIVRVAAQAAGGPVRHLRRAAARLRPGGRPAPVAGAGPEPGPRRAGGRSAAGELPRTRGGDRGRAVGPARRSAHPVL